MVPLQTGTCHAPADETSSKLERRTKVIFCGKIFGYTKYPSFATPTFAARLKRDLPVGVTGETDDLKLREAGEKVVSPRHGNLGWDQVNLRGGEGRGGES